MPEGSSFSFKKSSFSVKELLRYPGDAKQKKLRERCIPGVPRDYETVLKKKEHPRGRDNSGCLVRTNNVQYSTSINRIYVLQGRCNIVAAIGEERPVKWHVREFLIFITAPKSGPSNRARIIRANSQRSRAVITLLVRNRYVKRDATNLARMRNSRESRICSTRILSKSTSLLRLLVSSTC